MTSTKTDNRGGARKGAGRPSGKKYVQAVVTFKDAEQAAQFKSLGGSKWLQGYLSSLKLPTL